MNHSTSAVGTDRPAKIVQESTGSVVVPVVTVAFVFSSVLLIGVSTRYSSEEFLDDVSNGPIHQMVFVVFGLGMAYLQFIEGRGSRGAVLLRLVAGPLAAAAIAGIVYLSGTRDQHMWRNSISAYYHSSAGFLLILAGFSLGYLLFTESTAQNRIVIRGREFELYRITDGVRIASAVAACVLALFPTAPDGGDLYSDNSVMHGFASLVLFVGLIFQVVSYYLEIRNSSHRTRKRIHFLCGWGMFMVVLLCIAVIAWKVGGSLLFILEAAALTLYFTSFTTRNYPRALAAWRKLTSDSITWYGALASRFDRVFARRGQD